MSKLTTATVTDISPDTTPDAVLKRLADHISGNPFATDRKSVMVAAKGRELTTALQRAKTLRIEADAIEAGLGQMVSESIAILNGTHPGLSAGGPGKGAK
jgi:hypothetical protein